MGEIPLHERIISPIQGGGFRVERTSTRTTTNNTTSTYPQGGEDGEGGQGVPLLERGGQWGGWSAPVGWWIRTSRLSMQNSLSSGFRVERTGGMVAHGSKRLNECPAVLHQTHLHPRQDRSICTRNHRMTGRFVPGTIE